MDPPKFVGPKSEAWPGLRSKSVELIHCLGKLAQEWCVGLLVSSNGMPSNVSVYWPSAKLRKNDLPCPRPIPFGLRLNAPGACWMTSAKSATGAMKFVITALLISVLAEVASSVLPAGAVSTAINIDS